MKEDIYEFDTDDWEWKYTGDSIIVNRRKKPKVAVEWSNCSRFGDGLGENGIDFSCHGYCRYHIVQFRVTGFEWKTGVPLDGRSDYYAVIYVGDCPSSINFSNYPTGFFNLLIGLDARDKFSCPVLLPEEVYSRLPEICAALEQKANQGG